MASRWAGQRPAPSVRTEVLEREADDVGRSGTDGPHHELWHRGNARAVCRARFHQRRSGDRIVGSIGDHRGRHVR